MQHNFIPTFFLLLTIIFSSCEEKKTDFSKEILGKWEYEVLDVTINDQKPESKRLLLNDEKSWYDAFRMKPMQVIYAKDGFFKINYHDAKGNFRYAITGDWTMEEDQLTLVQDAPYEATFRYTVKNREQAKGLQFSGLIDWDNDKADDDNMTITLKPLE